MLALELKKSLAEIGDLSSLEVEKWRAFLNYRRAMEDYAAKKADRE